MTSMQAIHFKETGPPSKLELQRDLDIPSPKSYDLLIRVRACSVNPVDTKIRQGAFPASDVTGYDAAGVVEAVGDSVVTFESGDEVYASGVLGRPGTTAQYYLIDSRLAAKKPKTVDFAHAAAFPLVSLTAWELLVDHFGLVPYAVVDSMASKSNAESILIINGAGGVGSIATQLARHVFKLQNVIVTASRTETIEHAKSMGATHVINHHKELKPQLEAAGIKECKYIMICHSTPNYIEQACEIASCWGKVGSIVETDEALAFHIPAAFTKALSFHWEFMLAKGSANVMLESQGRILKQVAKLIDQKILKPIVTQEMPLTLSNLIKSHEMLESGKTIGKIVLTVGDSLE